MPRRRRERDRPSKTHQLTVRFGDEEWGIIDEVARYHKWSWNDAVRCCVLIVKEMADAAGMKVTDFFAPIDVKKIAAESIMKFRKSLLESRKTT